MTLVVILFAGPGILTATAGDIAPHDHPTDFQSTSGPQRPVSQMESARRSSAAMKKLDSQTVITGVPAYDWHRGCGPTAAGMVLGYWDGHGFDDIVPGSAATQTAAVDDMIAGDEHYSDYSQPEDSWPTLIPDGSETNIGGCHADNSLGDFIRTSWSSEGNYYGWSWSSRIDDGLEDYVALVAPYYGGNGVNKNWSSMTWAGFRAQIDSNQPAVFLVDSNGDNSSDHFVTAIGYGTDGPTNLYACLDTWDSSVHWYDFAGMSADREYGICAATYYSITGAPPSAPSKPINPAPTNNATGVAVDVILSWNNGGGAVGYDVYFGTNSTPGPGEYKGSQPDTMYSPGLLERDKLYYWRIDATNGAGLATGDVWGFTTAPLVIHYVSHSGSNVSPFTNWANASVSIQAAIDIAVADEQVLVSNGIYTPGARITITKDVNVTSLNGHEHTIIDAQQAHPLFLMSTGMLNGFTLVNGNSPVGGGVIFNPAGIIVNCRIEGCSADNSGGGIQFLSGGSACNCIIVSNSAGKGGGVYFQGGGVLANCTLCNNRATQNKGGGGFYTDGNGSLWNTIIYHNQRRNGANYFESGAGASYTNCCTTPALSGGGNITNDPCFVDYISGDCHVNGASPCIEAGANQPWMATTKDPDGRQRILGMSVDIGAYERDPAPAGKSCTWTNGDTRTSWEADVGGLYRLQASDTLLPPDWQNVGTVITCATETIVLTDTNAFSPCLFYRAVRIFP